MIRYYIPSDGDDPAHPNIFHLPAHAAQAPTLRDVRQHFPLPGSYHFRFKKRLDSGGKASQVVWLDVTEDSAAVPTCDGGILAKVSRLSMDVAPATAAGTTAKATAPQHQQQPQQQRPSQPMQQPQQQARPASSTTATAGGAGGIAQPPDADPFNLFSDTGSAAAPTAASVSSTAAPPAQRPGAAAAADLLNFDAFGSTAAPPAPAMQPRPPMMGMPMGGPPPMGRTSPQPPMMGMPPRGPMGGPGPRPPYPGAGGSGTGGWM